MKKPRLTTAQINALLSARDHGDASWHIHGVSAHGGFGSTARALRNHGFIKEGVDMCYKITPEGRAALKDNGHQPRRRLK